MKRFLVPIFLMIAATSALAQEADRIAKQTRIAKQSATITGDRGLFTVPSVETLNRGQFAFGVGWSNFDRTPKDLDINTFPVSFALGVSSRMMFMGSVEAQRQVKASNPAQVGYNAAFPYVTKVFQKGIGDTWFGGKYRIWRQRDNVGGMALKGAVKIGTADPAKGLGTGQIDGSVDLIFTSALPWILKDFLLQSTMGVTATRNGKTPTPLTLKDEMRSGLGFAFPSASPVQAIFEYSTSTVIGASSPNLASVLAQNPNDVTGGVRVLFLNQGLTLNAGYTVNRKFDRSDPGNSDRTGFVFSLSFTRPIKPVGNNHYPVVGLEADSSEIAAGGSATITATGYDADNDPLTYSWTATAGKVEGTGATVTFRAAGLAPGKYTVRATAVDGKGGTATSEIDITVKP